MSLEQAITDLCIVVKELTYAVSTLTETIKAQASNVTTEPVKRPRRTKAQIEADERIAHLQEPEPPKFHHDAELPESRGTTTAQLVTMHLNAEAAPATSGAITSIVLETVTEPPAPAAAPPTKEETLAAFQALVAKFGKEAATEKARKILAVLGAPNISGLPEDKRAAAIAAVNAELGA